MSERASADSADLSADQLLQRLANNPDAAGSAATESVARFVPGPGIERLALAFDLDLLVEAYHECVVRTGVAGDHQHLGFGTLALTRRPGVRELSSNDLSGRYWMRADERYVEEPFEDLVDEAAFSEFNPDYAGTYFETVVATLQSLFPIGRVRVNVKGSYNCNSWHRDPEPRLHVPIISNPGSLFVVNHHVTHLPADGSVYFTDTRGYHTALNGGSAERVHLIAALAL